MPKTIYHNALKSNGITFTQFRLTPRLGAEPGDFAIWLGSGEERTQLATLTVTPMQTSPITQQPINRTIVSETESRRLIGYDWDHTLPGRTRLYLHWQTEAGYQTETLDEPVLSQLPPIDSIGPWGIKRSAWAGVDDAPAQHYVPFAQGIVWTNAQISGMADAEQVTIRPTFHSSQPILRDLALSVRLVGYQPDSNLWAWWDLDDSIPAMGAIPTLKWIEQSRVNSPHFLQVNETTTSGQQLEATLRIYDAFTNRPLPILDERIVAQNPWIPLENSSRR